MRREETPVLVVGAGPVGLSAALLLARQGIGCRIVERRPGPQRAPAAHVVNARTFEIWRQAGLDMERILGAAKDPRDAGFVHWVTKLGGDVLGRLPFERQGDDVLACTPTPLRNLSQHRLEPILVDELRRIAGIEVSFEHEWERAEQSSDGVASRVIDRRAGETYEVRSRYLLAADGAGSPIRRSLGIALDGPERLQSFLMIHFAANLRPLVCECPGVLYWICDPESGGMLVAHDIDREWVLMHPWDPAREPRERFTPEVCAQLALRAIAASDVPLSILNVSAWTMTAQVAERYADGRVFLIGDAAHRFPPTGGLGLNTGVQDAHNLVWKLAAVESGWAHESLLASYEIERRPVAQRNAEQSLSNAIRMLEVPQALGASEDVEASRSAMASVLADSCGRERVRAAIESQAEHFDMLGLQLGFAYGHGAVFCDEGEDPATESPVRELQPTSRAGARLPHGWVERNGRRVSTLDLIAGDRFTLLAGPRGADWIAAARDLGVPVETVRVGVDVVDPEGWWASVADMEPDGALLVRPDQHVAFRSRARVASARAALERALSVILGRRRAATG